MISFPRFASSSRETSDRIYPWGEPISRKLRKLIGPEKDFFGEKTLYLQLPVYLLFLGCLFEPEKFTARVEKRDPGFPRMD